MKQKIEKIMGIILIVMIIIISVCYNFSIYNILASASNESTKNQYKDKVIVIDPGHGGFDPGKIGINKENEKDINLKIALKLKKECEKKGIKIVMTRDTDTDLSGGNTGNKKKTDMYNRASIINESDADICVSIHQNSYNGGDIHGAQVFYHSSSEQGKNLANIIQNEIKEELDTTNKRISKENSSYYILKKSNCPTVIVECGFLSNWNEANNLKDEFYQERMAKVILKGILKYFDGQNSNKYNK